MPVLVAVCGKCQKLSWTKWRQIWPLQTCAPMAKSIPCAVLTRIQFDIELCLRPAISMVPRHCCMKPPVTSCWPTMLWPDLRHVPHCNPTGICITSQLRCSWMLSRPLRPRSLSCGLCTRCCHRLKTASSRPDLMTGGCRATGNGCSRRQVSCDALPNCTKPVTDNRPFGMRMV